MSSGPLPRHNYHQPPHEGRLNYELNFTATFADFLTGIKEYEHGGEPIASEMLTL